jgi:hypothetical protein
MWVVAAVFFLAAGSLLRAVRAGGDLLARPGVLTLRVVILLAAALFWGGLVNDQMPCFLGVPNCD